MTESQDFHFHAGELWPDESLFTLSQLQQVWPMTSIRYRAAILSRMPALGLESYLRTVLPTDDDGVALESLVDASF